MSEEGNASDFREYRAKVIAMYFPQFHAVPENDQWWGEGFTDWNNVRSSRQQFAGHYQPRVPLGKNYYDQSKIETIRWQIDLAKRHGIYGFCHYHYWFDGKQLLEKPTNLMLEDKGIDFPFCLSWANETWSRRWDGRDHHILIQQTHPPTRESWKKHFDYLIRCWSDPRAIKIDGKPLFIIYRPHHIEQIAQMLDYWRDLAVAAGLKGLYIMAQKQYEFPNRECIRTFDGVFQFQPFEAIYTSVIENRSVQHPLLAKVIKKIPEPVRQCLRELRRPLFNGLTFYDYGAVWQQIIQLRQEDGLETFPGAFIDWDNAPRYKNRATIFRGASPGKFRKWFDLLLKTMPDRNLPENFIFLNAWNEWSEGTYLEPDERNGFQYLEAVHQALQANSPELP